MTPRRPSPFELRPDSISHDTVAALEDLLQRARSGDVIGVAFAAMLKRRGYIVSTSGEAHRNPTFARGMVAALDDEIAMRVRGKA